MSANSTFQSCRHQVKSIIAALSNVVTLIGNLKFTDSITGIPSLFGTAVFLQTTHPELKSSLNITTGANVYFVNLTCGKGGAVYGYNAMMHIGAKARVVFMNNIADGGAALYMLGGMITVGAESSVTFTCNCGSVGGAVYLDSAKLVVDSKADLTFSHNSAETGGALNLVNSIAHMNSNNIKFYDSEAPVGGAMDFLYGTMITNTNIT